MIKLETINFFILAITGLMAYIPTVTLGQFFSAWLADEMGDDTAKNDGFLTLNIFNHIDPFYLLATLLFLPYLGFVKSVPVNVNNIYSGSFKKLRIAFLFFIDSLGYLIVFTLATFLMKLITVSFFNANNFSSFYIVLLRFFRIIFTLTIFFIVVEFCRSLIKTFIHFYFPEFENNSYYFLFLSLISLILILLFGSYIEYFIILYKLNVDKLFNYLFL